MWKPKEEEKVQINEDEKVETEWDEVLAQATEEELVDLAGLYFISNQIKSNSLIKSNKILFSMAAINWIKMYNNVQFLAQLAELFI